MNTNLALYKDLHVYFYVMYTFMFCCVVGIFFSGEGVGTSIAFYTVV